MTAVLPDAVVFDFDGTMIDSEMPIYRAYAAGLAEMGHTLTIPGWATVVGHGEDDSYRAMCAAVGAEFDRDDLETRYDLQDKTWRETVPALPGVIELLTALNEAGVPCGIASSSPARWIDMHLERLGLVSSFQVLATRDSVGGRTKPDPASYRYAAEQLGADPARSVAIEDSAPGVTAALAAGFRVVAVPSEITQHTDLGAAHLTVASIADLTVATLSNLLH